MDSSIWCDTPVEEMNFGFAFEQIDSCFGGKPMFMFEARVMVFIGSADFGSDFSLAALKAKVLCVCRVHLYFQFLLSSPLLVLFRFAKNRCRVTH